MSNFSIGNQAFLSEPSLSIIKFVQHNLQQTMDMNMNPSYEYDGIDEDNDVFYAEIRRQILILTADDDDHEDYQEHRIIHADGACKLPGSNRAIGNLSSSLQHGGYFSSWETDNTNSVPTWLANLWRNGNGTGVFIPNINKSRRRHVPGRMNKRKAYRPVQTKQYS